MAVLKHWLGALVLTVALIRPSSAAPPPPVSEYELKAVCLFYFAKFTDWPTNAFADAGSPIRIGVLGVDPFGEILDKTVKGKTVRGRPVEIVRSRRTEALQSCHLVFVSAGERGVPRGFEERPVLLVGETEDFLQKNGMIQFVIVEKKVRFAINQTAVERARLKISSEVLRLAQPRTP